MLLLQILKLPAIPRLLARIRFLSAYSICLSISARGFFYTWVLIFFISLMRDGLEFLIDKIDILTAQLGIHYLGIAMIVAISLPLAILLFVICIDCLIAGLRARSQFLLGSLFSSENHDKRLSKLQRRIALLEPAK